MIISHFPGGGAAGAKLPEFSYSGVYSFIDEDGGNWHNKFLTSGTFIPLTDMLVDIFVVGGGGGGGTGNSTNGGGGGGAGGYTATVKGILLTKGTEYVVTIGAGGDGTAGGTSSFATNVTAAGGEKASVNTGGTGGSGGGSSASAGGSDGRNGYGSNPGIGQGTTTREFGEEDGELYAGGGAGGATMISNGAALGGEGGGGDGCGSNVVAHAGHDNTGGGGGGGSAKGIYTAGAKGGSGIAIIRNAR